MTISTRSGSVFFLENSSSFAPFFVNYTGTLNLEPPYNQAYLPGQFKVNGNSPDFDKTVTNTVIEELTIKYFQRVYDDGTEGYCYYTKTEIDPTPSAGETTPNYTGTISDHSIVKILEIF